jgi:F0F1-type ATP synthase assembly protein I
MEDNIKTDEEKTNKELLEEVKKLRESTEKENDEKRKDRGYSGMMWIGLIMIAAVVYLWQCTGLVK